MFQRITSSNPNNPESPFFDISSAPMKPAARLHIIRQREYRKACPPGGRRPSEENVPQGGWSSGIGGAGQVGDAFSVSTRRVDKTFNC